MATQRCSPNQTASPDSAPNRLCPKSGSASSLLQMALTESWMVHLQGTTGATIYVHIFTQNMLMSLIFLSFLSHFLLYSDLSFKIQRSRRNYRTGEGRQTQTSFQSLLPGITASGSLMNRLALNSCQLVYLCLCMQTLSKHSNGNPYGKRLSAV